MIADQNVPFVVLTTQRSGSTWVIDVLNKLRNTKAYGELLLNQERTWDAGELDFPRFCESPQRTLARRPRAMFAYLDELYRQRAVVGFKLMYSQIRQYPEVLAYVRMRKVRVIHLVRKNYIDIQVSQALKEASGRPHVWKGREVVHTDDARVQLQPRQEETDVTQVRLDPRALLQRLRWLRRRYNLFKKWLSWSGQPHVEVVYEDLLQNNSGFEVIRDFLDIGPDREIPQTDMVRIRTGHHAEVISNYDEVRAMLRNTDFADLLQDA